MKTVYALSPLILFLGGCAAMQWLGMADATGDPTVAGHAANELVRGLTGIDVLALWKTGEALVTQRGRDNLRNVFSPKTGAKSTVMSLLSLLVGSHTPDEAKREAVA